MSKTKKAEKIIQKWIKKHARRRESFRLNDIVRKHRRKLPMTFAIWNLVSASELRRTVRGHYTRG